MVEIEGQKYLCTRGSDGVRDGMYLELRDEKDADVLEIFYSDKDGSMVLSAFQENISLPVVEWLITQAKLALPPTKPDA